MKGWCGEPFYWFGGPPLLSSFKAKARPFQALTTWLKTHLGFTVQASLEASRAVAGSQGAKGRANHVAPCPLPPPLPPLHPAFLHHPGHIARLINTFPLPHMGPGFKEPSEVTGPGRHPPLEQKVGDQPSSTVRAPSVTGLLSARCRVKCLSEEVRKPCVGGRLGPQRGVRERATCVNRAPAKRG